MTDDEFKMTVVRHMARIEEKLTDYDELGKTLVAHSQLLQEHTDAIEAAQKTADENRSFIKATAGTTVTIAISAFWFMLQHMHL